MELTMELKKQRSKRKRKGLLKRNPALRVENVYDRGQEIVRNLVLDLANVPRGPDQETDDGGLDLGIGKGADHAVETGEDLGHEITNRRRVRKTAKVVGIEIQRKTAKVVG